MDITENKRDLIPPISIIVLLAVGIRLAIALLFTPPLLSDEIDYVTLGKSIVEGTGMSISGMPTASRAPAYPAFIALIFSLFDHSMTAFRIFQAVADSITCYLIFVFCRRIFSLHTAFTASAVYALFPGNAFYVSIFMTEIVFTTLLMTALVLVTSRTLYSSIALRSILGGILGVLALMKPSAAVIILFFFIWEWYRSQSIRQTLKHYLIIAAGFAVIVSPWMIRNGILFDHFSLTSNGGVNFWIGHNDQATGSFRYYAENNPLENISGEFERSQFALNEGLNFIIAHPLRELQLIVLKFVHLFEPDFALMQSLLYRPEWGTYSRALLIYQEFPPLISLSLHALSAGIIITGLWGMIFAGGSLNRNLTLLSIIIIGWTGIHVIFFSVARFRIPIMPLLIIMGSYSFEAWRSKTLTITPLRRYLFIFFSLLLAGSWLAIFGLIYLVQ